MRFAAPKGPPIFDLLSDLQNRRLHQLAAAPPCWYSFGMASSVVGSIWERLTLLQGLGILCFCYLYCVGPLQLCCYCTRTQVLLLFTVSGSSLSSLRHLVVGEFSSCRCSQRVGAFRRYYRYCWLVKCLVEFFTAFGISPILLWALKKSAPFLCTSARVLRPSLGVTGSRSCFIHDIL